jgi:hypothetical protein
MGGQMIGTPRALVTLSAGFNSESEAAMVAYTMIAVLSVLAFLCISHVVPSIARHKAAPSFRPNSNRAGAIQK